MMSYPECGTEESFALLVDVFDASFAFNTSNYGGAKKKGAAASSSSSGVGGKFVQFRCSSFRRDVGNEHFRGGSVQ